MEEIDTLCQILSYPPVKWKYKIRAKDVAGGKKVDLSTENKFTLEWSKDQRQSMASAMEVGNHIVALESAGLDC